MSYPHLSTDCHEHHRYVSDSPSARILTEVDGECIRQVQKWGEQNHPDGTDQPGAKARADLARNACDGAHRLGVGTWAQILKEEFYEALAEEDPAALRNELVQVAAVAVTWIRAIDRRARMAATAHNDLGAAA